MIDEVESAIGVLGRKMGTGFGINLPETACNTYRVVAAHCLAFEPTTHTVVFSGFHLPAINVVVAAIGHQVSAPLLILPTADPDGIQMLPTLQLRRRLLEHRAKKWVPVFGINDRAAHMARYQDRLTRGYAIGGPNGRRASLAALMERVPSGRYATLTKSRSSHASD